MFMFGNAVYFPNYVPIISGTGQFTIEKIPACIEGDEKSVKGIGMYTYGPYTVAGTCEVTIERLNSDQLAPTVLSRTRVIVKGTQAIATLEPKMRAKTPGQNEDQMLFYKGTAQFLVPPPFVYAG
ncbi:hypothetical protein DF143_32685 [Burkholderia cenocepacia]|nr:hypothetical protein DF143_32685 [Burkholderia cenocepacia]